MRPIDFTSPVEPTATTRSEATSGMTVMRIALTQVPTGAMKSAARMSQIPGRGDGDAAGDRRAEGNEDTCAFVQVSLTWVAQANNVA